MNIKYSLDGRSFNFVQEDKLEVEKLNFLLTNNRGDFLNLGVVKNSSKFQGFNVCNPKTLDVFKCIDEFIPQGLEVKSVNYGGYYVERTFSSKFSEQMSFVIDEDSKNDTFGAEGKLKYNDDGVLEEVVKESGVSKPKDRFYLGPSGGMVYEIFDFQGDVLIDLDVRKIFDFSDMGRNYKSYRKDGVVFVKYEKKDESSNSKVLYDFYIGIKAVNFAYDLIEDWVEKHYSYSKMRNTDSDLYVYRLMKFGVSDKKKVFFGAGFSEEEVLKQIFLLEGHQGELEGFDQGINNEVFSLPEFDKPLVQDVSLAYSLCKNSIYKFLNKGLDKGDLKEGIFAGFPWFSKVWTRDELVGLKAFIDLGENAIVKDRLFYYLSKIDEKTGEILRIDEDGSFKSLDTLFWLSRRFLDFLFYLDEKDSLSSVFSEGEISYIYEKLSSAFKALSSNFWDKEKELLKIKDGDSWMDTIHVDYPVDIQVQLLDFVSNLAILASISGNKQDASKYLDFEDSLKLKIRDTYFRDGKLYAEAFEDRVSSNVFLVYYLCPGLFLSKEWEMIFDSVLKELDTFWGGFSSLSKFDSRFCENYSGENNESYHNGDSWYWINNLGAMVLNDLNEQKYRKYIRGVLLSSTADILKMGTVGFGSEISSASCQKAEGCLAQFWSSSTYLEMIDKLFGKKGNFKRSLN